jgi:hydrogenase-4 component B
VVVKVAIYGLVLSLLRLLGPPAGWWGYLVLALGAVTAFYGVLFSVLEHDLKRALAFSTVENLGFLITLLGAALLFSSLGNRLLESLALVALALHALNHALLKGLLFLGAGSAQMAAGGRDMDALGGLVRRMRWTAVAFFVGAAGLAGVPPLNGFQGEWLGLQVLLQSHLLHEPAPRLALAAAGALMALTLGLAVTTFIRIFGGVFLGLPRGPGAERATEAPPSMVTGTGLLAAASVALGLLPPLGLAAATAAAGAVTGQKDLLDRVLPPVFVHPERFPLAGQAGRGLPRPGAAGERAGGGAGGRRLLQYRADLLFMTLAAVIALVALALGLAGVRGRRRAQVWAGAIPAHQPSMQYTATAFTNPLRFVFGTVYRSSREIEGDYQQAPFFARSIRYTHRFIEPVEAYIYLPVARGARLLSDRLSFL